MFLYKIKWFIYLLCFYTIGYSGKDLSEEHWIAADDLHTITINMTAENIKNTLGEPLFIESSFDVDDGVVTTKYYYNFRTKEYDRESLEAGRSNFSDLPNTWGRSTNIQFVFNDDRLVLWEEDKLTLMMAKDLPKEGSSLSTFNFFLNIIVITLNAAVLMSL